ncbi:MgtC/SapB family protein [Comamonas endophytica]|uniref:Protein MgtC n=1 Tax=Comamonas endophytica TaxID=2949090 RepID=A0ABY6G866_9BURK|nr:MULTISPECIES: MgtC/SapB family protein [unclassified Acidovorax]MCD2514528.1 MgtC/SapB family protein [Acidovorax sp. D4N7]UYG51108.1 MgtC/SapB family protein [Acidovorax sp. 5MLIR]
MDSWWNVVGQTMASEFADAGDVEQTTRVVLRLVLAALLGGMLGWQREVNGKAAGIRTHMLVSMGAALIVMVGQQAGGNAADLSRVLQGLIAGVGFLGAGTILKTENRGEEGDQVKGLTTAAGIWLTAAIGACAGVGKEVTAILSAVLALGVLSLVPLITPVVRAAAAENAQKHKGDARNREQTEP